MRATDDSELCRVWEYSDDNYDATISNKDLLLLVDGIILLFNITERGQYLNLFSDYNWFEKIKNTCPPGTPIVIVGTSADKAPDRKVTAEEAK